MVPAIPPQAFQPKQAASLINPGFVAGRWYWSHKAYVTGGTAIGTTTTKLHPFYVPYPITVSDLACQIITTSAAGNVILAIYASDPVTHFPAGLPLAACGVISTTTAGSLGADITGADVALAAGWYWAAAQADNATVALLAPAAAYIDQLATIGTTAAANLTNGSASPRAAMQISGTTYGTWPNATSTPATEILSNYFIIGYKVSAVG